MNIPIWNALSNYYNVCIFSLITKFSIDLWSLYSHIGGTKNETFASYADLPAVWINACTVIENEIARIKKEKDNQDKCDHQIFMNNLRNGNKQRKI